jgi:hypothetical protein
MLKQLLSQKHYGEVRVFLLLRLLALQSSHNAIQMVEHVIEYCDDLMRSNHGPVQYTQGSLSEWP